MWSEKKYDKKERERERYKKYMLNIFTFREQHNQVCSFGKIMNYFLYALLNVECEIEINYFYQNFIF